MRMIDGDALLAAYDAQHQGSPGKARELIENAPTVVGILKEQEPIPVQTSNGIVHCGNCGKALIWIGRKPKPEWKYCAYCGKRVKWDEDSDNIFIYLAP